MAKRKRLSDKELEAIAEKLSFDEVVSGKTEESRAFIEEIAKRAFEDQKQKIGV